MSNFKNSLSKNLETIFDPEQRIWNGKCLKPVFQKNISIGQVSLLTLGLHAQKVVQICDSTGERLTCDMLRRLGIKVAQYLKLRLGQYQEDVVGIMANNSTFVAPVILGALLAGTPVCPLHHSMNRCTVSHIYGLTKPKVIFCDDVCYPELMAGLDDISWKCNIYLLKGHVKNVPSVHEIFHETESADASVHPAELKKGGEQTAFILCTSGTTGKPKGVCVSHRQLLNRHEFSYIASDDVLFKFGTLHWISGIWFLVQNLITGALQIITDQPFTPEVFLEIIEKYKVTQILAPPAQVSLVVESIELHQRDLSSVKVVLCGGAPVSMSVSKRFDKFLKKGSLYHSYGLTEFAGMCCINNNIHKKGSSVGLLTPNTKIKILSEEGKTLGVGEVGELWLWTPSRWEGYYQGPTSDSGLSIKNPTTIASWLKTGDMGYFDEDGFLYVCGRQKDMMKFRHILISPTEIEEVIQNIPGVIEVCVLGVPDPIHEDVPTAVIVKRADSTLTEDKVCEIVANVLPEEKHLHGGVFFLQELPRTASGKVTRNELLSVIDELKKNM